MELSEKREFDILFEDTEMSMYRSLYGDLIYFVPHYGYVESNITLGKGNQYEYRSLFCTKN
jgi:hypothetical protein